jgi:hypothetical protein
MISAGNFFGAQSTLEHDLSQKVDQWLVDTETGGEASKTDVENAIAALDARLEALSVQTVSAQNSIVGPMVSAEDLQWLDAVGAGLSLQGTVLVSAVVPHGYRLEVALPAASTYENSGPSLLSLNKAIEAIVLPDELLDELVSDLAQAQSNGDASTVHDDNTSDQLVGAAVLDLFFASLGDEVLGRKKTEWLIAI